MTNMSDDYNMYIEQIKTTPTDNIRADIMIQIKRNMIKRTIIRVTELIVISLTGLGMLPSFLG